eukprot:UN11969
MIISLCHPMPSTDPRCLSTDEQTQIIKQGDGYKKESHLCNCIKAQFPRTIVLSANYVHIMKGTIKKETYNLSIFDIIQITSSNAPFTLELSSSTKKNKMEFVVDTKNELQNWVKYIEDETSKL